MVDTKGCVAQTKIYIQAAGPSGKVIPYVDHWVALGMDGIRVGLLPLTSVSLTSPVTFA